MGKYFACFMLPNWAAHDLALWTLYKHVNDKIPVSRTQSKGHLCNEHYLLAVWCLLFALLSWILILVPIDLDL